MIFLKMNKEKFDYYWKIALIIILLISLGYMFKQFSQINEEGLDCIKQPFVWGAREFSKKYDNDPIYCSCQMGDKSFSFDDRVFNPKVSYNYVNLKNLENISINV